MGSGDGNRGRKRRHQKNEERECGPNRHHARRRQEREDCRLRLDEGGKDHRVRGRAKKEKKENEGEKDIFSSFTIMKG